MSKALAIAVGSAAAAAVAAGCGSAGSGAPKAAPTATHTVARSPAAAQPAQPNQPAPTVTKTVYPPASGITSPTGGASSRGANQVITRFNGAGTQNTASFTTPGTWHLSWAYWGCPDGEANFQVYEYNSDGSADLNGVTVNELGTGRGPVATFAYGDAGTHYLSVNTEGCSWSLVPVTG